jgi:hypothetical protein
MREAGVPITASSELATSVGVCQIRRRASIAKKGRQRWPRPWPFVVRLLVVVVVLVPVLVLVLILLLRSAAVERPISALSPKSSRLPRCTYRLSVRVFISCCLAARRFAMTNLRALDLATVMPRGLASAEPRSLLLCFGPFP